MEICILLCGGNIQQIYSDTKDIAITLIDADNMIADGVTDEEIDQAVEDAKNRLHVVW